jgi:IS1 family transposase
MNRLTTEKRAQISGALVEGNSIRATVRMTGAAKNTVTKLLVDLGAACAEYQDRVMIELPCRTLQCDEIWSFCSAKDKNVPEEHRDTFGYGDVWTWTAICADTKLVPSWLVGERNVDDAWFFMNDLARRLTNRVQLTTHDQKPYLTAVDGASGGNIDYAMLIKKYGVHDAKTHQERKYSPNVCTGMETKVISGRPDPSQLSTSYVERQNLTMRMGMRRFTRLTSAFSKKAENLAHAVSLHYMYYNFARVHQSLTITNDDGTRTKRTPAMAAGITGHVWTLREIAGLLDAPSN